jgi:hypothetical protein
MNPSIPASKASFSSATFSFNALLSDGRGVVSRSGTIAAGIGVVARGTIVKYDPATGNITIPVTVTDCNAILSNDYDSTAGAVPANVYMTGKFKANAIVWPGALGHGVVTDQLRDYGIYIESVVDTPGTLVKTTDEPPVRENTIRTGEPPPPESALHHPKTHSKP